jgi:hypothetical protein
LRTPIAAYRQRGRKRRVLVESVRFLAGYRRPGLVDQAPLELVTDLPRPLSAASALRRCS